MTSLMPTGGGIIDLVVLIHGCDRQAALRWLAELAGVPLDRPLSQAERVQYRRRCEIARVEAVALVDWRYERLCDIRLMKRDHWGAYHRALTVIEREGIATELGALAADVIEASEREIAKLDQQQDRFQRAPWDELIPEFRAEQEMAVAA